MRLSMDPSDPGHHELATRAKGVTLDGKIIRDVIMADEEAGEILHAIRDAKGKLQVQGENFATEVLKGKVHIICSPQIRQMIEESRK